MNTNQKQKTYLLVASSRFQSIPLQIAGPFFLHEIPLALKTLQERSPELEYISFGEKEFEREYKAEYLESWNLRTEYFLMTFLDSFQELIERPRLLNSILYNREIFLRINKKEKKLHISISTIANARNISYIINELRTYLNNKLTIEIEQDEYYLSPSGFFSTGERAKYSFITNEIFQN